MFWARNWKVNMSGIFVIYIFRKNTVWAMCLRLLKYANLPCVHETTRVSSYAKFVFLWNDKKQSARLNSSFAREETNYFFIQLALH